jgi:hypothetical protein
VIAVRCRTRFEAGKVVRRAKAASITSLGRAGAYIRGIAARSIKVSPQAAPLGQPPHTRKGRLKGAILYAVEKAQGSAVIGPTRADIGRIGHTHEFGGTEAAKVRKGRRANWKLEVGGHGPIAAGPDGVVVVKLTTERQVARAREVAASLPPSLGGPASNKARKYPPRPFMGPALEVSKARLPRFWANSVKGG